MVIKKLEKELKKLQKIAEQEEKTAELKRKIKRLKFRKFIKAREKIREKAMVLGYGTKKLLKKMKEMEKKKKRKSKKKVPKEDYLERLNKALS